MELSWKYSYTILVVLPLFNLCTLIEYCIASVKVSVAYTFFGLFECL